MRLGFFVLNYFDVNRRIYTNDKSNYWVSTAGLWRFGVVDYHWSLRYFMVISLSMGEICLACMCHIGKSENSFSTQFVPTTGELEHEKIAGSKCG